MTLIINKAAMGYIDVENRNVLYSKQPLELTDNTLEYLHKKIEKTHNIKLKKVLNIPSSNEFLLGSVIVCNDNKESDVNEFLQLSNKYIDEFANASNMLDNPPNAYTLLVDYNLNDDRYLTFIKLNCKKTDKLKLDKSDNEIVNMTIGKTWIMPSASAAVDEAIVINCSKQEVYLQEKKYDIDGKKAFYISNQLLHCETDLSYEDTFKFLIKVLKKVNSIYEIYDTAIMLGMVYDYIEDKKLSEENINIYSIVNHVLPDDKFYEENNEALNILNDLGFDERTHIPSYLLADKDMSQVKIKTDNDIEIKISAMQLLQDNYIVFKKDEIVLSNVNNISAK